MAPAGPLCASTRAEVGDDHDLALLAHDLLPDWTEDWLDVEREGHRQQRLHALEQASALLRSAGRYPDALVAGLVAVNADALRETAHRRVIEVHLSEGNHAAALRQFDRYRRLMAHELGLPPPPSATSSPPSSAAPSTSEPVPSEPRRA